MKLKSQWDFGELFPEKPLRRIWTVSELTSTIRQLLERQVGQVWVSGEITNLRQQSSGHVYFTLKDSGAQLSCVLFRGEMRVNRDWIKDGQRVLLQGELTVYEPRGQYQLRVMAAELQGLGALQLAFERLKQQLQSEGLFAPERKRPIPRYPQRIGIVTSPTGAALRDVLTIVQRRNPTLEVILAPCRVQGEGAGGEIARSIGWLNQLASGEGVAPSLSVAGQPGMPLDVILVTRGGGSLEDLWAFNEEGVARAIAASRLPVVSAVGHEIDFTISDFVADLRAPTPSAAAELLTEGVFASRAWLEELPGYLRQLFGRRLGREKEGLAQWQARLARLHPRRQLNERWQRLDDLEAGLARAVARQQAEARHRWSLVSHRLLSLRLSGLIARHQEVLAHRRRQLHDRVWQRWQQWQHRWQTAQTRLQLLSPAHILARGYSITRDAQTGQILRQAQQAHSGQKILTRLHQGEIGSVVDQTNP